MMRNNILTIILLLWSNILNAQDFSEMSGMLRLMMIHMNPLEYQLDPIGEGGSVYGSVIDISGNNENFISVIILSDGSVSILTSNGSGMIENVKNQEVKDLSIQFLNGLSNLIKMAQPIDEIAPPEFGEIQVFVITTSGVKVYAEEKEKLLNSPLGSSLITIHKLVGELSKQ